MTGESGTNSTVVDGTRSPPETDAITALRASDISRSFGDVSVLTDVSLSVSQGDVVAVVGPNGSGKSTLMEVLAGVRAPDQGTVSTLANAQMTDGHRDVGYLPQRPAFREGFSARATLQFYARLLDDSTATDVDETLERIGLAHVAGRNVGSLSGGMTRLLGLGQAILGRPSVLVLDEPGSGLDPTMIERIFTVLDVLAAEGRGIVVASHHLAAIEKYADTVVLLDRGGVVVSGPPAQLLASTGSDTLVETFLGIVNGDERESTVRAGITEEATDE